MNPFAGEVALVVDGERHVAKLTLGALAELEAALQADSLIALIQRFEDGRFTARDVLAVVVAGLRGGGWRGQAQDLLAADLTPADAARAAAALLARAFALPEA